MTDCTGYLRPVGGNGKVSTVSVAKGDEGGPIGSDGNSDIRRGSLGKKRFVSKHDPQTRMMPDY